jgi:hypothetical protein
MDHPIEKEQRIFTEQALLRSGEAADIGLCQYKTLSCVRCCLPHIGGDTHRDEAGNWLGPGGIRMKFTNFNPLKDPRIEASHYEDAFSDVGRGEMERRFSQRRQLFLELYDPKRPAASLPAYMNAAQKKEGYRYRHTALSGPASMCAGYAGYAGGSASTIQQGELPECHLLGHIDAAGRVGCLAHPLAATSRGHDGRDRVGYFHHSGCCDKVGCEAVREFPYLSPSARKVFDKAVEGMSWYDYSRHATSVLVYYLRSYDHLAVQLDERNLLDTLSLPQLVDLTNALYEKWPLKKPEQAEKAEPGRAAGPIPFMDSLQLLSTGIPLKESILYIALGTGFTPGGFNRQLQHARDYLEQYSVR